MERKLTSVQIIKKIEPIEGADAIEKATVLGWQCVVKKGEFKEGDLAVYCEVDSFLPIKSEFEFLRKSSYRKLNDGSEGFRLKTIKLRGQVSQGLLLPLDILNGLEGEQNAKAVVEYMFPKEGTDVTEILGITKWDPPLPAQLGGMAKGNFPSFIHKTDETRVQSCPKILDEINGKPFYITEKADGSSMTVYYVSDEEKGVCSRNLELKEDCNNSMWKMAEKYKLLEILKSWKEDTHGNSFCIQCEIVGPGIQKNPMGLKELEIRVFNWYCITTDTYLDYEFLKAACEDDNLPMVKVLEEGDNFNYSLEELLEKAKGKYESCKNREGIVIRPKEESHSEALNDRMSFKVINNDYLIKDEE